MQSQIKAPRGTNDVLGKDSYKWRYIERTGEQTAESFGFKEVRFPTFEDTELFDRGVGGTTDIVQKEMYTFTDKGGRSVTLRPEGTASVVRQTSEHGLFGGLLPIKAYYIIPCFRYEKPQAGRYREFHQFGVEMFGPRDPSADVEVIRLAADFLFNLGISSDLTINSIGCPECRRGFQKALKDYFEAYKDKLCQTCLDRLERNPMRILDCKSPVCKEIAKSAPLITDYLCEECENHYIKVKAKLSAAGISYVEDPHIVRGLDYYTKTVFEFLEPDTGLALLAGGRYDLLVKEIDGKNDVPGLGFASGIERLISVCEKNGSDFGGGDPGVDIYLSNIGEEALEAAENLAERVREAGFSAQTDLMNRSLKAQMKYADKIGAKFSAVVGEEEVKNQRLTIKNMESGLSDEVSFSSVAEYLSRTLSELS
ncbi:MAG: histidine--tRNA ligase [Clostridiales bacterium]|nr:histidine--tRNA ligase [Clostridiales bacterium]